MTVAAGQPLTVEQRTSRGALIGLAAAAASAPLAFGVSIALARVSPAALGFYALLTLLLSIASTFLTLGGPAVASRFTPLYEGTPNDVTTLQAIVGVLLALVASAIAVAFAHDPFGLTPWQLMTLVSAVALWVGLQGAETARLRFGSASLVQSLPTAFQFVLLGGCAILLPHELKTHSRSLTVASYVIPIAVIALFYSGRIAIFVRARAPWRLQLPKGFWRYSVGAQLIVSLSFFFEVAERGFAALRSDGLATLGVYFAVLQTAQIVRRVPAILGQAYLPGFASLAVVGDPRRMHYTSTRFISALSFLLGTALVAASGLLVFVFGRDYRSATVSLGLLAIAYAATAASPLDCSYATATGRLRIYQLGLSAALVAFLPLLWWNTVLAFAVARCCALLILQAVVVSGFGHVRGERLAHAGLTIVIGLAEIAAVRMSGSPAVALLAWLSGAVVYWRCVKPGDLDYRGAIQRLRLVRG